LKPRIPKKAVNKVTITKAGDSFVPVSGSLALDDVNVLATLTVKGLLFVTTSSFFSSFAGSTLAAVL
jgi:hypothetical protein